MMIMRIVHVVGRNGVAYEVPMTAEQAAFFLRLTEFKAAANPGITFHDVVADWQQKQSHAGHSPRSQREELSA
jgi:hypothetical protein